MNQLSSNGLFCPTGTPGLDEILGGGLPANRIYLIQGNPGVGKTTLALQFLLEGKRRGERGLYITLSETREELEAVAESHGWSLDGIDLFELSTLEEQLGVNATSTFFHPSEVELNRTTQALLKEVDRINPVRLVFDSLSELRLLAETPLRYRKQILQLKQYFAGQKSTVLFLDDRSAGARDLQIESVAHGVLGLFRLSPSYGDSRRHINIQKIRGLKFRQGNHDFIIQEGGVVIFPRIVAADYHTNYERESVSSGLIELDSLLGGGLDRGTANMFMGPPGTGKSTLAIQFALNAAKRDERVNFYIFDETKRNFLLRCRQLGMEIEPFIDDGTILLHQIDPAEVSPGEFGDRIRNAVLKDSVRIIVIDSINGYIHAMPEERNLNLQLHELLSFLNQQGVITIMVLAQQGLVGSMTSSVDLTYLADTVVLLRYFEARGSLRQAISVVKKRTGYHERTIREMRLGKEGIIIGTPLIDFQGVLTGVPSFILNEVDSFSLNDQ
jgi:circadian clock protein KaiC